MFKIKHIKTGKYLSNAGFRCKLIYKYYSAEHWLSKVGKTWGTKKGPERVMKWLEAYYPGEFEIQVFVEK